MKDNTPYYDRPRTEIVREQNCMEAILASAPSVSYLWEAFGGLAVTAQVLRHRFPEAKQEAVDLDKRCVDEYNSKMNPAARCQLGDALDWLRLNPLPGGAGVSLDFNKFTVMDVSGKRNKWKSNLVDLVVKSGPSWVQLTDSAVRYLHLNWSRYGCRDQSLSAYLEVLGRALKEKWGLEIDVKANHHAATYLLLKPK